MKEIIVKQKNRGRIEKVLEAVQSRVKVRWINYNEISKALQKVENYIDIPKMYLDGVKVTVDVNAQDFPNAYKYTAESTIFRARFSSGTWRITEVFRGKCRRPNRSVHIELTDAAKGKIIERMEYFRV